MRGEPIESMKVGLTDMIASLRQDPYALETACISIISFDSNVQQILPLTDLADLQIPNIQVPESGATFMGAALELMCQCYDKEVNAGSREKKGDWMPLLFIPKMSLGFSVLWLPTKVLNFQSDMNVIF